jgi:hypothetical protein
MVPILFIYWILDRQHHFFATDTTAEQLREKLGWLGFNLVLVVFAPWVETLFGQALPSSITRLLRLPASVFLVVSTVWFAGLHGLGFHGGDFWVMTFSHLFAAFLLAFTFLQGRKHSEWRAIWMTACVHMLSNFSVALASEVTDLAKHSFG